VLPIKWGHRVAHLWGFGQRLGLGCCQDRCRWSGLAPRTSGRLGRAFRLTCRPGCRHRPGSPAGLIRSLSAPGAW